MNQGKRLSATEVTRLYAAMNHSQNPNVSTGDGSFYAGGDVTLSGSTLKGMTETLTDACTKLLPLVLSLFALI